MRDWKAGSMVLTRLVVMRTIPAWYSSLVRKTVWFEATHPFVSHVVLGLAADVSMARVDGLWAGTDGLWAGTGGAGLIATRTGHELVALQAVVGARA